VPGRQKLLERLLVPYAQGVLRLNERALAAVLRQSGWRRGRQARTSGFICLQPLPEFKFMADSRRDAGELVDKTNNPEIAAKAVDGAKTWIWQ